MLTPPDLKRCQNEQNKREFLLSAGIVFPNYFHLCLVDSKRMNSMELQFSREVELRNR